MEYNKEIIQTKEDAEYTWKAYLDREKYQNEDRCEDDVILDLIKESLDDHDVYYRQKEFGLNGIEIPFRVRHKSFIIQITVEERMIFFDAVFPWLKPCQGSEAIMALRFAECNIGFPYTPVKFCFSDSELHAKHVYMIEGASSFVRPVFIRTLKRLVYTFMTHYAEIWEMSVGSVPFENRERYKELLSDALKMLESENGEETVRKWGFAFDDTILEEEYSDRMAEVLGIDEDKGEYHHCGINDI